jgi:hypothetical protein
MNLKQRFFITILLFISHKPIKIYKSYYDDTKNLLFYASITFFYFYFILFDVSLLSLQQNKRQWTSTKCFCEKEHEPIKNRGGGFEKRATKSISFFYVLLQLFYSQFSAEVLDLRGSKKLFCMPPSSRWCDRQKEIFQPNKFHDLIFPERA